MVSEHLVSGPPAARDTFVFCRFTRHRTAGKVAHSPNRWLIPVCTGLSIFFQRPYVPTNTALPKAARFTIKPTCDAVALVGGSSLSTPSAYKVK